MSVQRAVNPNMDEKILKGPKVQDNVRMSIGEYFWQTADRHGNRIFQIHADTGKAESFAEVRKRAMGMGLQQKDVLMVCCDNNLDCIVPILAALFLGACVVSSMPSLELFDLQFTLNNAKPKVVFVVDHQLNPIKKAIQSMQQKPQLCVIGDSTVYPKMYNMEEVETEEEPNFVPVRVNVNDTAFILFSSGTTGIRFSHLSTLAGPCRANGDQIYQNDTPIIQSISMYWVSSVWITAFSIIYSQPRIVATTLTAERFYELVDKYKISCVFISYLGLVELLNVDKSVLEKYDLSTVKYVTTGGAYVDPKNIHKLRNIFSKAFVVQSYGSTELGCSPTFWDPEDTEAYKNKPHSVGKVSPNVQIKVMDLATREPLGPNIEGEILVKSPYRMIGFSAGDDASVVFDEDGFLKSGDIGYYDEKGYFFITDRLNEIVKIQGIRISPRMVESVLKEHPAVAEAVVFGVHDEVEVDLSLVACVTVNYKVSVQELSDHVVKNTSKIYRPRGGVYILAEMPRTPSGKISRREVKKLFVTRDLIHQ